MKRCGRVVESRLLPVEVYLEVRTWLLDRDLDACRMAEWCGSIVPPPSAEKLASEIIWIILCAGRSAQAARTIERRVWDAINSGRPAIDAFGYRAKAEAIDRAWREREADMAGFLSARQESAALLSWCGSIPFVGETTKFQLAKNLGADVCKPDIWLSRLAGYPDRPSAPWQHRFADCMRLCSALSSATGDSVSLVDSLLWLACNKGILCVSAEAGPVSVSSLSRRRSIFGEAGA